MTLLAPLAGLLAGVLGVLGVLALHALRLRRRPVRVSSTLLWKDATRDLEVNTPWRAPRPTLLLFLQVLGVAALALAIARPVLGASERVPARVVVVLDASASMSAADAGGLTRFGRAQRLALDRIATLRRGSSSPEISVVLAAGSSRMALTPTRSLDAAARAVREAQPTDQPLDPDALREPLDALRDRPGDAGEEGDTPVPPALWVFTDAGVLAPPAFAGWSGEIVATNADATGDNAGIAALHATRDPADPSTARVFVRVVSNADHPTGVVLRVSTPAQTVPVAIDVPARTDKAPGSATRTVGVRAPGATRIEATIDHGGVLASDDRAWADLPDPRPPRTVVYAPDAKADPFLMDVLNVLLPGATSVHAPTDLEALRSAELVVYDRVTPAALPPVPSLGFGSGWPGSRATERTGRERVVAWDRAHPVLRDVSLASVVFDRAATLPDADTPGVSVLAESTAGPVITETVGAGVRHLRVAFPLERSNWAVDVGMPIFVAASVERLAPGVRGEGAVFTTSEPVTITATADRVVASGPADASAPRSPEGVATLGPLPRVGVYTLTGADRPSVAVSLLDANESLIPAGTPARFGSTVIGGAGESSARRELWPWALLLALGLMTLEWFVHAVRARV